MVKDAVLHFDCHLIFSFESRKHLCFVMQFVEGEDCANLLKTWGPSQLIWQGRGIVTGFRNWCQGLKVVRGKFSIEKGDVF
jgi:hypothetical protein